MTVALVNEYRTLIGVENPEFATLMLGGKNTKLRSWVDVMQGA